MKGPILSTIIAVVIAVIFATALAAGGFAVSASAQAPLSCADYLCSGSDTTNCTNSGILNCNTCDQKDDRCGIALARTK